MLPILLPELHLPKNKPLIIKVVEATGVEPEPCAFICGVKIGYLTFRDTFVTMFT